MSVKLSGIIELLDAIDAVRRKFDMSSTEGYILQDEKGTSLGRVYAPYLINTANQNPGKAVWFVRDNGQRICSVTSLAKDEYELLEAE